MVLLLDVVIDVGCKVGEMLVVEEVVSGRRVVCGSEVISGLDVWVEGNSDVLNVVASSDVVASSSACIQYYYCCDVEFLAYQCLWMYI